MGRVAATKGEGKRDGLGLLCFLVVSVKVCKSVGVRTLSVPLNYAEQNKLWSKVLSQNLSLL